MAAKNYPQIDFEQHSEQLRKICRQVPATLVGQVIMYVSTHVTHTHGRQSAPRPVTPAHLSAPRCLWCMLPVAPHGVSSVLSASAIFLQGTAGADVSTSMHTALTAGGH